MPRLDFYTGFLCFAFYTHSNRSLFLNPRPRLQMGFKKEKLFVSLNVILLKHQKNIDFN